MHAYRMKMLERHRRHLRHLLGDTSAEQACFLLCSAGRGRDATVLVVEDILPLQPDDLARQGHDILSVGFDAMMRAAQTARHRNLGLCMIHTHPMCTTHVDFSDADDRGNEKTFEFFNNYAKHGLHSCLVFSGSLEAVAGRVYPVGDEGWRPIEFVEVSDLSPAFRQYDKLAEETSCVSTYSRQSLLLGKDGQRVVENLRLGVIGVGGLGSSVTCLLAHSGVRELRLFDPDVVEAHNRPRLIGSTPQDADKRVPKVEVAQRYVQMVRPDCVVHTFKAPVQDPDSESELVDLDALIIASDGATSRKYATEVAQKYRLPLVDLGVQFVTDPGSGEIEREFLKINLVLPNHPCLYCVGHIPPSQLAAESMPPEMRKLHAADGYVRGFGAPEPSMMVFNQAVAARGVQVLLGHFTGLSHVDLDRYETLNALGIDAPQGSVRRWKKERDPGCPYCEEVGS